MRHLSSEWLGLVDFGRADGIQREAHRRVVAGGPGEVLGFEHPTVITLGLRGRASEDLFLPSSEAGPPVVKTDRGGQATLHSPGQLVIYPILPFKRWGLSPKNYVRLLLETTSEALRAGGIPASSRTEQAGVYTDRGKIAFCGLRLDHGVSRHGLSINVRNDLDLFRWIRPCGMRDQPLSSVERESSGALPGCESFFGTWMFHFKTNLIDACSTASSGEKPSA